MRLGKNAENLIGGNMIRHRFVEHLQELEHIRRDTAMSPEIISKVDELQLLLTEGLRQLIVTRQVDSVP